LFEFVDKFKDAVQTDPVERHRGILKKDLYKEFLDEIVPLSCFAVLIYPETYQIQPVLGNQGYDALVFNESGVEIDRIEMTAPHDGNAAAKDARQVVKYRFGEVQVGEPGDDFEALIPDVVCVSKRKAQKDYSDCTLVIAIEPLPPFENFEGHYETQVCSLIDQISQIKFKAKRVFILILPDQLESINS